MKTLNQKLLLQLCGIVLFLFLCFYAGAQTPVQKNGQLKVCGTKLCNQYNNPIQLRGMSTHGIQWFYQCLTDASLDALAYNWGSDILRISLYVQEGGYETDPVGFTAKVTNLINEATERGMYALVDWHQLDPGDPNANLENAKRFFTDIANAHKSKNNIIYDICNEPNGVAWSRIKTYADQIIPVIRAIDGDAPIFIGTHGWGSLGISDGRTAQDIVSLPVNFPNIMYTFHFYAASHGDAYLNELDWASDRLPIFVTEFGTQTATGDGTNNFIMSQRYIDLMRTKKIGWTNWNFSDDFRSGAVWNQGTCSGSQWTTAQLKPAGAWVRERMLTPADDFPGGGNIAPTISITSPSNNATFTAPASITINATASDSDGTITKVEFFRDGVWLGEDTSSPYSFTWSTSTTGTYAITARATDNLNAQTNSATVNVSVTTSPTLPSPWATSDVGAVSPAGNASYSSGTFTVNGSGADIWGTADAFRYVYRTVTGDVEITAKVNSLTNTNAWAKSGVMIRQSLSANSAHASALVTPTNGTSLQRRTTTGGNSEHTGSTGAVPTWLRLKRAGSTFTASKSTDGVTWTTIGTTTIAMNSTIYVGLAITSHANGSLATSAFSNVTVSSVTPNTPPSVALTSPSNGATFTAPANITISANASDSDGTITQVAFYHGSTLIGSPDVTAPYSVTWSGVGAGSYSITARATDNAGAVTTSAASNITVSTGTNAPPSVSITSPSNGATFTAPASITINANASDSDGSISQVAFYHGSTMIGSPDATAPYSVTWSGVAAGNYSITARATDNTGAVTTSSAVSITYSSGTDNCSSVPQYVENGGYVAGSNVKNGGNRYQCKPYPYSGWCNGSAWAYAPGSGSYWQDAWTLVGSCSAGRTSMHENVLSQQEIDLAETDDDGLALFPNPSKNRDRSITLDFKQAPENLQIYLKDMNGSEVYTYYAKEVKTTRVRVELPSLPEGMYFIRVNTPGKSWIRKYLIQGQ